MEPDPLDAPPQPGSTRTTQEGRTLPRLPHEHDESADSQASANASAQAVGRQAYQDLERGQVDTDRGPLMNWVYQQLRRLGGTPLERGPRKPPR